MNTRLAKRDSYTPETLTGLAKRCDWFVHNTQLVKNTDTPRTVFISGYRGYNAFPFFITRVLPLIQNPFVLIIASEDHTWPRGHLDLRANYYAHCQHMIAPLLTDPRLLHVFVENLDTAHPKLTPIPLGLLVFANYEIYAPLIRGLPVNFDRRTQRIFACHRNRGPDGQWADRHRVATLCATTWKDMVTYREDCEPKEFRNLLMNSQFCLCVHGGGVDPSPRAFEALLCGAIPILEHSTVDGAYRRYPVVYVDAWTPDAVTPEKLDAWLTELRPFYEDPVKRADVLRMLTMDYWWDIITAPLKMTPA
jgi:hypothetical protein